MRRALLLVLLALLPLACRRGAPAVSVVEGPQSTPGWEVRYNASVALARRGSDKIGNERVRETLHEMLDEEQQMRNFRRKVNGKEISDAGAAQATVITALQAFAECHRRNPAVDLAPFAPLIEKLAKSGSLAVSTEAKRTQQLIAKN